MLIIDNTSKLKNIMEFKRGSYYKFVALIRAKDYKDSGNQILTNRRRQEVHQRKLSIRNGLKTNVIVISKNFQILDLVRIINLKRKL